jgi:HEAT repeat protein
MLWWTYQQLRVSSAKTRLAVVQKLAENRDPDAAGPLIFALNDKEAEVRCAAATALMKFDDRRAVEPLIKMLQEPIPASRAAAAETLGHLGDPVAVNNLVGLLRDHDSAVRSAAARSLDRLGWKPGTDSHRMMQLLAMGNLQQLVTLGTDGVEPLLELLRTGTPNKQFSAVKALAQINDPRVRPAMIEALSNNSTAVRIAALGTLERLADANAYPRVEKLLRDHDPNVRGAAIEAALRCGGVRSVPALTASLKDQSWEVRQAAANALGLLGERSAVEGLCGLINDADRDVREKAIIALGQIRDPRAIVPLVPAMLDPESTVRAAAANTLHRLDAHWEQNEGISQVVPIILKALTHTDYWVSHSATKLLELLKIDPNNPPAEKPAAPQKKPAMETAPHPALEILVEMLVDRDRDFRLAAAVALGGLREKNAGSMLTAAAHDSDEAVRQAVQTALAALN